jgi:hypothetical protein
VQVLQPTHCRLLSYLLLGIYTLLVFRIFDRTAFFEQPFLISSLQLNLLYLNIAAGSIFLKLVLVLLTL